jgi:hypothetical protein
VFVVVGAARRRPVGSTKHLAAHGHTGHTGTGIATVVISVRTSAAIDDDCAIIIGAVVGVGMDQRWSDRGARAGRRMANRAQAVGAVTVTVLVATVFRRRCLLLRVSSLFLPPQCSGGTGGRRRRAAAGTTTTRVIIAAADGGGSMVQIGPRRFVFAIPKHRRTVRSLASIDRQDDDGSSMMILLLFLLDSLLLGRRRFRVVRRSSEQKVPSIWLQHVDVAAIVTALRLDHIKQ